MAFMLGAAIGGAAKRASEIFKEEAEAAQNTMDDAFKVLVELGLPAARKDKELRMSKSKIYDTLTDTYNFSAAQANVIMKQGRGQAVIDHINTMQDTYDSFKLNPADIVTITQDYEGDLTKDQVLENVLGKITGGMNVSDAITDITGKKPSGTLTSLFGGDEMAGPIARLDALTAATGVSSADLAAYASGERTYDPALVEGTVTLTDPLKPPTGGLTSSSVLRQLEQAAVDAFGGTLLFDANMNPRYSNIQLKDKQKAREYARKALVEWEKLVMGETSRADAFDQVTTAMLNQDFTSAAELAAQGGAGDGAGAGAGGEETAGMGVYKGMTASSIEAQLARDIKGITGPGATQAIAQARLALIEAFSKDHDERTAKYMADKAIERVMSGGADTGAVVDDDLAGLDPAA